MEQFGGLKKVKKWNGMERGEWLGQTRGNYPFGETILVIFDHSKWFENSLENGLKNGLTLQILRWYKQLRFKDIVQDLES